MKNKVIYAITLAFTLSIASMGLSNIHAIPSDRWCDNHAYCDEGEVAVSFPCETTTCTYGSGHSCVLCLEDDGEVED